MRELAVGVVAVVGGLWGVAVWRLRGEDMSAFDQPTGERFARGEGPGPEIGAVIARLGGMSAMVRGVPMRQRNAVLRKTLDELFADRALDVRLQPVDCGGVPGEWVLAPGADPRRRTLYIHGGAFVMGSPKSRCDLQFSALSGGAVRPSTTG